jgi:hypothetical protein
MAFNVNDDDLARVADAAHHDWSGEGRYLLAVLALLNSRNAAKTERVNVSPKLNAARARKGRPPLFDHHILKLAG